MSEATLSVERRGRVVVLWIDREPRMNALSRATVAEFGRVGRELERDPDVRAIVITGRGARAFSAGADLKERQTMDEAAVREQIAAYRSELGWIDTSPRPVVAAINGAALGGGLELALMCDLRVAASHAVLGLPETTLGIIPGAGGTQRLPRLIGAARAKELILFGQRVDAAEALRIGLVHRVTPAEEDVLEDTLRWIEPLVHGAPLALAAALRAIDAAAELPLAEGLELERQLYDTTLVSEDRREALRALAEKRPPRFVGK